MKNVQISFDEQLLDEIDRLATKQQLSRSGIVREALKEWIRRKEIQEFERHWIQKLKENSEDSSEAAAWMDAEKWEEE